MNYEEKYKEIVSSIKELIDCTDDNYVCTYFTKDDLVDLFGRYFPEIKMSKDEKMKKYIKIALISMGDNLKNFYSTHHVTEKEMLEWIDKKNEQNFWKPTEEQLAILEKLILMCEDEWSYTEDEGRKLLEQLKKLAS